MKLLTKGKTNWKYLLLLFILAVSLGTAFVFHYKNTEPNFIIPEPYFICPDGSHHGPGVPSEGVERWCEENGHSRPKEYIRLISPDGGEKLVVGNSYEIEWECSEEPIKKWKQLGVDIWLMKEGSSVLKIASISSKPGINRYEWLVPAISDTEEDSFKIRITTPDQELEDTSKSVFSIKNGNEVNNWKVYTNESYGFRLKYPRFFEYISTGPNKAQQEIEKGEVISGTAQPSLDTILFRDKEGENQFQIMLFSSSGRLNISEEDYSEKGYLYTVGPCDLRWGFKPTIIQISTVNNVDVLRVSGARSNSFLRCYYLKITDENLIVLSTAAFEDEVDFKEAVSILEKTLQTINIFEA